MSRDLRIGRWRGPTIHDDVAETIGDALEAVGAAVIAGESRARTVKFSVPIYGDRKDADPRVVAYRLRRQLRALVENPDARAPVYLEFAADPELNGWIALAGGDLVYNGDGGTGPTIGEFRLDLDTVYRLGNNRRQRPARRVELADRRLVTTPRDYYGTVYRTDFAINPAKPLAVLPPGARDVVTSQAIPPPLMVRRPSMAGDLKLIPSPNDGDVISYEQDEAEQGRSDVVIWHRNGWTSPAAEVIDSFDAGLAAWQVLAGNVANLAAAGDLVATGSFATTYVLRRPIPRHDDGSFAAATFVIGATVANALQGKVRVRQDATDPGTYIAAGVEMAAGGAANLVLEFFIAGVSVYRQTSAIAVAANDRVFVALSVQGDAVRATFHRGVAARLPLAGADLARDLEDLVGAASIDADEADLFRDLDGMVGLEFQPGIASAKAEEFRTTAFGDLTESYTWEEVYGPDQLGGFAVDESAFGLGLPAMGNDLCRMRPVLKPGGVWLDSNAAPVAFAIDTFVRGRGWVEQGRMTPWAQKFGAGFLPFATRRAEVLEWTPERAVLKFILTGDDTGTYGGLDSLRGELIVTLERGWTGPRFELYCNANSAGGSGTYKRGARLLYSPCSTLAHATVMNYGPSASINARTSDSDGAGPWSAPFDPLNEAWIAHIPFPPPPDNPLFAVLAPVLAPNNSGGPSNQDGLADATAYGTNRHSAAFTTADLAPNAAVGYVGMKVGYSAEAQVFEAETYRVSGTTVADALASGGNAARSVATAQTTLIRVPANALRWGRGTVLATLIRVKVTAGAARGQVKLGGDVASDASLGTSPNYRWMRLQETSAPTNDGQIEIDVWEPGGNQILVDKVILLPLERLGLTDDYAYDGARDLMAASLYSVRNLPDIVDR